MKKHWTIRYLYNRLAYTIYEKLNSDKPWLTPKSIEILDDLLSINDIGLEYGSGRSTKWLSKKLGFLTSIEDNESWYNVVEKELKANNIKNINYVFKSSVKDNGITSDYENEINKFGDGSLDFVLVDGSHRANVATQAVRKVRNGGIIVIDNANWFMPHNTYAPTSVGEGNPPLKEWVEFTELTINWRLIWTTNGVSDTAIFIKK